MKYKRVAIFVIRGFVKEKKKVRFLRLNVKCHVIIGCLYSWLYTAGKARVTHFLSISLDFDGWKKRAERSQIKGPNYSALGKNSGNLLARAAPVQPVHGRVDWAAKYGSHR